MSGDKLIEKAYRYAEAKHEGQYRKDGKQYFTHVSAVADIVVRDWLNLIPFESVTHWTNNYQHVVAAAYLHDVIEDCSVTKDELEAEGFSILTAEIVEVVSRKPGENYLDYITRILDSGSISVGAIAVKLADLRHNISDLGGGSSKDKYELAHYILMQKISRVS